MSASQLIAEAMQQVGSPESIRQDLEEFRESALALSADHPRLIDEYREEWVAVHRGEVVAHGRTMAAVLKQVDAAGLPRSKIIVRFITEDPRTLIL